MIKTKKSKKKRIGLILCSLFICLCSILCIVPFNQEQKHVSADTIESSTFTFTGSPLFIPFSDSTSASNPTSSATIYTSDFYVSYTSNSSGVIQSLTYFISSPRLFGSGSKYFSFTIDDFTNFLYDNSTNNYYLNSYTPYVYSSSTTYYISTQTVFVDVNYPVNNQTFYISEPRGFTYLSRLLGDSMVTQITYFDAHGRLLSFRVRFARSSNYEQYVLPSRTYYFDNNFNFTDNEYYNQGFNAGQQDGYNIGYNAGESAGYKDGYSVGQTTGYNNGYSDGMEDSNQYTFLNLLSATIDAPVKYFQSLFNFELLGVNLQGFLTGLFTLCVIVTIVKLCLGG